MNQSERDTLVVSHMEKVRWVARELMQKVPHTVAEEDLVQAGMVGLINAANKFDPERKIKFWTHANYHVRGAMLDSLRSLDLAKRTARQILKKTDDLYWEYQNKFGTSPTDQEYADMLKMPVPRWLKWKTKILYVTVTSIESRDYKSGNAGFSHLGNAAGREFKDRNSKSPADQVSSSELAVVLRSVLEKLPARQKLVLEQHFFHDKTLKEAALMLGVVESRVSQLKTEALLMMRAELEARGLSAGKL